MRYMVIRTENLTKEFGQHTGLKNLTLEVEPGEVFGFLGQNGAGKTTTIKLLLDLLRPTSGRALVLGMDSHRDSLAIRRNIGYLPANPIYDQRMTSGEILRYLADIRGGIDWKTIESLSTQLGLALSQPLKHIDYIDQRKIGLVQAFMHQPELLILDEPTLGLDNAAQQTFYRWVSIARSEGRSVFLSSQSVSEMERVCDRVGVLHDGELVTVERCVHLRARSMRHIEMRFAQPVSAEAFAGLPNIHDLRMVENTLSCTVHGDPDALIKTASQFRVLDFISQTPSLEEIFGNYYGVGSYAG